MFTSIPRGRVGNIGIKDGAYIGSGSHIMQGVTIGEGCLVATGSIVAKSIPKWKFGEGILPDEYVQLRNTFKRI